MKHPFSAVVDDVDDVDDDLDQASLHWITSDEDDLCLIILWKKSYEWTVWQRDDDEEEEEEEEDEEGSANNKADVGTNTSGETLVHPTIATAIRANNILLVINIVADSIVVAAES
jgi:CO dehydrogenase/acetyl-CoA synthase beta subunit